jgi:hypothetical protein
MKKLKKILTSIAILIISGIAYSGPTVIQDNRITNIATTPVLGRGYSISTNTFQSTCLTGIKITEPSYDFTYTFDSLEKESDLRYIDTKSFSSEFRNQLKNKVFSEGKSEESTEDRTGTRTTTSAVTSETKIFTHHIFVVINLNSYYASVDESKTKMSTTAAQLILNKDIPGFFSSCGSYYVRSIGRNAKFVSIFTYKTRTDTTDARFETQLEEQIKGFGKKMEKTMNKGEGEEDTAAEEGETTNERTVSTIDHASYEFRRNASSRQLTITVAAFGLGKNEKATLISYDIDTFKAAIKDAFLSMQNPRTGKVSSIEVVPWVENTEFQNLIKLHEDEPAEGVKPKEGSAGVTTGGGPLKTEKRKLLLYEKKQLLNQNAEFLAEIERADRNMMNIYYKAKICKQQIDINYKNQGSLKPEYRNSKILNNRTGETIMLSKLDQILSNERIDGILKREKLFMYGSSGVPGATSGGGAAICMKKIMRSGIFRVSYREFKECNDLIEKMANAEDETVENFCMPILTSERKSK